MNTTPTPLEDCEHLIRIAWSVLRQSHQMFATMPAEMRDLFDHEAALSTFSGYTQGLQRAAGEIAKRHGITIEQLEKIDEAICAEPKA